MSSSISANLSPTRPTARNCSSVTSPPAPRWNELRARWVLFDAYSPYFTLVLGYICGIPSITLTGTVDDWQKIRSRVDELGRFGLRAWCRSLRPITYQFIRAAQGNVDKEFWQHIYGSVRRGCGSSFVTGWITRFYPYLHGSDGAVDRKNPLLALPIADMWEAKLDGGTGISVDSVPRTLAKAIVTVNDRVSGSNAAVALYAGLVGVGQEKDGALQPIVGWHLTPAPIEIDAVVDRLVDQHDTTPALDPFSALFDVYLCPGSSG
jgi:hypothetical protein